MAQDMSVSSPSFATVSEMVVTVVVTCRFDLKQGFHSIPALSRPVSLIPAHSICSSPLPTSSDLIRLKQE